MDAVEFVKTVNRLCKNLRCKKCPVYKEGICTVGFNDYSVKSIEETVSKIEQWAKDHPAKTKSDEFLKLHPDAMINADGVVDIPPCFIEKKLKHGNICENFGNNCDECTRQYWLKGVDD